MFTSLQKISTLYLGGAIYSIIKDGSKNFLLGLGLWDRENEPHTLEIKNQTKGQVVRVDSRDNILARSLELDNIIYQLQPISENKIFVGCRDSHLYYLNYDLSIAGRINIPGSGLYFWHKQDNLLIATMREGSLLFFNTKDDSFEILPIVDKKIRMWALLVDEDLSQIVCGSYNGDLIIVQSKKIIKRIKVSADGKKNSVWVIEKFGNDYWVGTASGAIYLFDQNLSNRRLIHQNQKDEKNSGITSAFKINGQIIFGDIHGNLHFFNGIGKVIDFDFQLKDKTPNTIWWLNIDDESQLLKVAHCNGSMETFRIFGC